LENPSILNGFNEKLALASVTGSLLFMLDQKTTPIFERIALLIIGTVAAYFSGEGITAYFHLDGGVTGMVSFFFGVISIPIAKKLIEFVKNPQALVDLIKGFIQAKKGENGQ
jgi:hypothetical protein